MYFACNPVRQNYINRRKMVVQLSVSENLPLGKLVAEFGPNLTCGVDLAPFTSYKTGGLARYFLAASNASELVKAIKGAKKLRIPCFILGGGTNILVSDEGFDGVVIKVDVTGLEKTAPTEIKCGAGESLADVVDFAADNALTGLEFAAGIYGSLGGAIYGNAGAYGGDIGSVLKSLTLVKPDGELITAQRDYCGFGYRDSNLKKTKDLIVDATLELALGKAQNIKAEVSRIIATREEKLPANDNSAGCFFKNIPDKTAPHGKRAAGQLLDEAGAKQLKVKNARVSPEHANIIVNTGLATSKEISQLADKMKQTVKDKFGITLEEEVIRVGKF